MIKQTTTKNSSEENHKEVKYHLLLKKASHPFGKAVQMEIETEQMATATKRECKRGT